MLDLRHCGSISNKMLTLLRGLCPDCSRKLNYHSKKREVKKLKKDKRKSGRSRLHQGNQSPSCSASVPSSKSETDEEKIDSDVVCGKNVELEKNVESLEKECWTKPSDVEDKSREDEFDEYLEDLLL